MAYTQDDLARIERALSSAEQSVRDGQTGVEYRSIAELTQARDMIIADLAAQERGASATSAARGGFWGVCRGGSRV